MTYVKYKGTSIPEAPILEGRFGRAWRVNLPPPGQRGKKDLDATVDAFLLNAYQAHPLWDYWLVSMVALRPIEGVKKAFIRKEGATHELMIASLNPEEALPSLTWNEHWNAAWMTPLDVTEQFHVENDAQAAEILEMAIRAMCEGRISPDQDYRPMWKLFIQACEKGLRPADWTTGSGKSGVM